jgi:hypothetical protein
MDAELRELVERLYSSATFRGLDNEAVDAVRKHIFENIVERVLELYQDEKQRGVSMPAVNEDLVRFYLDRD